jgi:hypothetical protein
MNKIKIQKLLDSPLFNLSLSSRELFHSNFLYWLANLYPEEFGTVFIKFCKVKPTNSKISEIYREKNNIDLSFKYENGQEVIIENKVKSIPDRGQLERYSKKSSLNQNCILLSLSKPVFFNGRKTSIICDKKWYYVSYLDLIKLLKIMNNKISDNYHKNILLDYIEFIDGLIHVDKLCKLRKTDLYTLYSKELDKVYKLLFTIRLHDFYLKKKYQQLSQLVYEKLSNNLKEQIAFDTILNWNDKNDILITFGMTRGQGLVDIKYKIKNKLAFGIQIQGEQYRLILEDENGKLVKEFKDYYLKNRLWFVFDKQLDGRVYPLSGGFNSFNNSKKEKTFVYKSIKISPTITIDTLVNIIYKDVKRIIKVRKNLYDTI